MRGFALIVAALMVSAVPAQAAWQYYACPSDGFASQFPDVPKMEYDFALLVLVENADGLEKYLKDPLHLKFVDKHGPFFDMEKLPVFDFVNQSK